MNNFLPNNQLIRVETHDQDSYDKLCKELSPRIIPHHEIYGDYCSLQEYISCPAEQLFDYLKQPESLLEWTYSLRNMKAIYDSGMVMFGDKVGGPTKCYCRTEFDEQAKTIDYHCAWDQSQELWMIYYMRVLSAETTLNKPASLVTWTNCCHPYYKNNPWPEKAPKERSVWVGDGWPFFKAGHALELTNLKRIAEERYHKGIDLSDLSHLKP